MAVFLTRGVAGPLRDPTVHVFGHPSDLKVAVSRIAARYPGAPIHLVCFSSGNGLGGALAALHDDELPAIK